MFSKIFFLSAIILGLFSGSNSNHPSVKSISNGKTLFESHIDIQKVAKSNKVVNLKAVMVICDHYISPENNKIAQSVRVDLGTMTQMLNVLHNRKIVNVERIVLQGNKASLSNIQNTLRTISAGPDDIVLFYFSGHGGMEKGKTFLFTADEKNIFRSEIENAIASSPARLKMIITDACSNAVDGLTATRSLSKGNQDIEAGMYDETYRELFLGYKGTMHLSASTEGEYAWSNDHFGGFFTYHFIKEGLIKKPIKEWSMIFENAKDKTSQMFMRMPAEDRSNLAKEGIKNQTAKAFAMPSLSSSTIVASPPPSKIQPTQNTSSTGKITLFNYTNQPVYFYLDNNSATGEWSPAKTESKVVNVGKFIELKRNDAFVGYEYLGDDFYFELEKGNYFFAVNENGILDLFYKEDHINIQNFSSVVLTDYNEFFLGSWEWEDSNTGETVLSHFDVDVFEDEYQESNTLISGAWSTRKETIDNEEYSVITFYYEGDDDSIYQLDYIITYDLEFPDEVLLLFYAAYENEEEIPYEEAEKYLESAITMYRVDS